MIPEVAGHPQEQIQEWANEMTEGQIQWIIDRFMAYANWYNDKIVARQAQGDAAECPLLEFWRECCQIWTDEATKWSVTINAN